MTSCANFSNTHKSGTINFVPALASSSSFPQPYFSDLTPTRSPLRPRCLAKDRLRSWLPSSLPVSTLFDARGQPLPFASNIADAVYDAIATSWRDSTKATYGSGLLIFHVFCDKHSIAEEQRAPCSKDLLAVFITSLAGVYAGSTIRNYVAGLRAWHLLHRIGWSIDEDEQNRLLASADTSSPESSHLSRS